MREEGDRDKGIAKLHRTVAKSALRILRHSEIVTFISMDIVLPLHCSSDISCSLLFTLCPRPSSSFVYVLLFCPFPSSFSISFRLVPAKQPIAQCSPVAPPLPSLVLLSETSLKSKQNNDLPLPLGCRDYNAKQCHSRKTVHIVTDLNKFRLCCHGCPKLLAQISV